MNRAKLGGARGQRHAPTIAAAASPARGWARLIPALFGLLLALGGLAPASAQGPGPGAVSFDNPPQPVSPGQTFTVEWGVDIGDVDFILSPPGVTNNDGNFAEWIQTITFPDGVKPTGGGDFFIAGGAHTVTMSGNSITDDFKPNPNFSFGLASGPFSAAFQVALANQLPRGVRGFTFQVHSVIISTTGAKVVGDNSITFPLEGAPPPTLALTLSPLIAGSNPGGHVSPGDTVHYRLAATGSDTIEQLSLQDTLPDPSVATLVPGSVTQGGQVSGNTIRWNLSGVDSATVEFAVKVKNAKDLPKNDTAVTDAAHGDATFSSGDTDTRSASSSLSLTTSKEQLTLNLVPQSSSGAFGGFNLEAGPGDTITYLLRATSSDPVNQLTVQDVLPDSSIATLVPGSVTAGGQVSGNTIQWTFSGPDSGPLSFQVKVKSRDKLPATVKDGAQILDGANAEASLQNGDTVKAARSVAVQLKFATLPVDGVVHDVIMHFPQQTAILLNRPVSGAAVRLLRNGAVVDQATTDDTGAYVMHVDQAGDYTVEVKSGITALGKPVVQRVNLTVEQSQIDADPQQPVQVDEIHLPVSLVNELVRLSSALGNLHVTMSPFLDLATPGVTTVPTPIDASAALNVATTVVNAAPRFRDVYRGSGPRDGWNGLIRLDAAMAIILDQATHDEQLVDLASKSAAIWVCLQFAKQMQTGIQKLTGGKLQQLNLLQQGNSPGKKILGYALNAGKITALAAGMPLLSSALNPDTTIGRLIASFAPGGKITPAQKQAIIDTTAKFIRFGTSLFIGSAEGDVAFEAVLIGLREEFTREFMKLLIEGSGGYQDQVNQAAAMAGRNIYSADTIATLAFLEQQNSKLDDQALLATKISSDALFYKSVIRAITGVFAQIKNIARFNGPTAALLDQMVDLYQNVDSFISNATGGKVQLGVIFVGINQIRNAAINTAVTAAVAAPVIAVFALEPDRQALVSEAFSGPVEAGVQAVRHRAHAASQAATAVPPPAASAAPPAVNPAFPAYLAVLEQVAQALQQNDAAAYAALRPALGRAEDQVQAYLQPLTDRAAAAEPVLASDDAQAAMDDLGGFAATAAADRGYLYLMLELWAQDPSRAGAQAVLAQLQLAAERVQEAGTAAAVAEPFLTGITVPGTLVVHPAGDNPIALAPGQMAALGYQVTNVGDTPVAGGTAMLSPGSSLQALSPPVQNLPALAPHQSIPLAWMVGVPAATAQSSTDLQVLLAPAGGGPANFDDEDLLIVSPNGTPAAASGSGTGAPPLALNCPADLTVTAGPGDAPALASIIPATASGAGVTLVGVRSDGQELTDPYPLGTTTITWTAVDAADDASQCTQTVTVQRPPTIGSLPAPLPPPPPLPAPALASGSAPGDGSLFLQALSPGSGPMSQTVMLHGQGFGNAQGSSMVLVGGRQVPVLFWTAGAIGVLMNPRAFDPRPMALDTAYPVQVVVRSSGKKSNTVNFLLTAGAPAPAQ